LIQTATLKDIFDMTPDVLLTACRYRQPKTFHVMTHNESTCAELFYQTKLVTQDMVCYRVRAIDKDEYHYGTTAKAYDLAAMVYQTFMPSNMFKNHGPVIPQLHASDNYGEHSRLFATTYMILSSKQNFMRVTYTRFKITKLEAPYMTKCSTNNRQQCLKACLIRETLRKFDKLHFSELYSMNVDYPKNYSNSYFLAYDSLYNRLNTDSLNSIGMSCSTRCSEQCHLELYITSIKTITHFDFVDGVSVRVDLPSWPVTHIEHSPWMTFNGFLIYIMSCAGTWLGLSIIQCNPFKRRRCDSSSNRKMKTLKREMYGMKLDMIVLRITLQNMRDNKYM